MDTDVTLASLIESLIAGEPISVKRWPEESGPPEAWGLVQVNGNVELPSQLEFLDEELIRESLSHRSRAWLQRMEIYGALDSTNGRLVALAENGRAGGAVCLAELQTKGRGRRGRTWFTPLGGNIALSCGFSVQRRIADLEGLSLVIGLALLDALQSAGLAGLSLKWPNDLLLGDAKVGGVLIELNVQPGNQSATQAIVGVGVNLRLPEKVRDVIDQPVTDLAAAGVLIGRNELVARVIGGLVDYVGEFERVGFAPMRAQYDLFHRLQGQECEVHIGSDVLRGRVLGVTDSGELRLQTGGGLRLFRGGEVSLRARE